MLLVWQNKSLDSSKTLCPRDTFKWKRFYSVFLFFSFFFFTLGYQLNGIMEILNRWLYHNKCTDTTALICLSFVWPGKGGRGVQGMIYGTSLNICFEICQRCNEIALLRSGARSVSGRYLPRMSQPHTCVLIPRQNTVFQMTFFVNCSYAEEKNKLCTVSRAPASTTLIYITLVFPIHADMVPYELLIELWNVGNWCVPLTHCSLTSIKRKI